MNDLIVKQSLIRNGGRGVFTTKSYKEGEYVCFYDGEIKSTLVVSDDFTHCMENPLNPGTYCVGYKEPRSKLGVGQFINDACMFTLTHDLVDGEKVICKSKVNRKIKIYETCSQVKANVIFNKGKSFKLYAKRDIAAGGKNYIYIMVIDIG